MQLYLITPEHDRVNEPQLVQQLLAHGAYRVHLRKKGLLLENAIRYLQQVDTVYHSRISIHDHALALLQQFPALGVHLNSYQRVQANLVERILHQQPASLSASFHSWKELEQNPLRLDYAFISPVFDSISKKGYLSAIDLAGCQALRQRLANTVTGCPAIVALGGICAGNIGSLQTRGFTGAALLGGVWEAADPLIAFQQVYQCAQQPGA